ncbi:MAG: cytoskeleton protein RodZ, partial [Aeromicrobium sp.]|nr:cytoskeleton protein RodZ [Aeromicrobium sp.]
ARPSWVVRRHDDLRLDLIYEKLWSFLLGRIREMTPMFNRATTTRRNASRRPRVLAALAVVSLFPVAVLVTSADAAEPAIDLGTAKAFSVLAGSGVSNTGTTRLAGSVGSYPTPTVGTDTPFVFTSAGAKNHAGDAVTQQAKTDLGVAYNVAAAAQPPIAVPQELSRTDPYLPGVYRASSSMLLSGSMTLDGGGRNDGVFVFQAPASTLTTASNSTVRFVNGAQPCNVYWQVGSSATFGTGTTFVGNVLAFTSITATTGATFEGRLLALNGAVTLDSNTITGPRCDTSGGGGGVDGATADGATADGATADGATADGATADGAATDIAATDGATADGATADGAGTDVDATDAPVDVDATDDAGTDADAATDTDGDATESAGGTDLDAVGTDAGAGTGVGTDTGLSANSTDTDLPDTGGSNFLPLPLALLSIVGGVWLVQLMRPQRGAHRA